MSEQTLGDILGAAIADTKFDALLHKLECAKSLDLGHVKTRKVQKEILQSFVDSLHRERGSYIPLFVQLARDGRKVDAIKEVRRLSSYDSNVIGLREAKNIIERMQ